MESDGRAAERTEYVAAAAAARRRFRQAQIVMNRALAESDLSALQYHLLLELAAAAPQGSPQVELARLLAVPEARISLLVQSLSERGLVKRNRVEPDRRVVRVGLTARGRRVLFKALDGQRVALTELVTSISQSELETLVSWGIREYLNLSGAPAG